MLAVYFKTLWNGWVTDDRMKGLLKSQGREIRPCMLGCGRESDRIEHYGRCSVYWEFLARPCPTGLGIPMAWRSAEAFLMLTDMQDHHKIKLALGMYALHMTVQHCRHSTAKGRLDIHSMLRGFTFRGANGSKARQLIHWDHFRNR